RSINKEAHLRITFNRFISKRVLTFPFQQIHEKHQFRVFIPLYEPLEVIKCKKCGKIIAEPKELIGIKQEI
ncbi:MAG: hypothetical protein OEZ18_06240, partial [Candidatus Bathyarchaeota archaeon]|nr:hypothetical protein [Candidatus Bathyarchaeota archaeon]